jgi:hypothetical protein
VRAAERAAEAQATMAARPGCAAEEAAAIAGAARATREAPRRVTTAGLVLEGCSRVRPRREPPAGGAAGEERGREVRREHDSIGDASRCFGIDDALADAAPPRRVRGRCIGDGSGALPSPETNKRQQQAGERKRRRPSEK